MFIVLVGPSGTARKGTAMRPGRALLREVQVATSASAVTLQALAKELANSTKATMVKLEDGPAVPVQHSSLTVFSEEFTVFLGYGQQELLANLCDWYDCQDNTDRDTVGRGREEIVGVWLNVIGATTPLSLQESLPDVVGGGFASRVIFVNEKSGGKRISPLAIAYNDRSAKKNLHKELVNDLFVIKSLAGLFSITEQFFKEFSSRYENGTVPDTVANGKLASYYSRRASHLMKLCMIMCAARSNDKLMTVEDLDRAEYELKQVEEKMLETFSGLGASSLSSVQSAMLEFIRERSKMTIDRSVQSDELYARFMADAEPRRLAEILTGFKFAGLIEIPNSGRDRKVIYIGDKEI